MAARSRADSKSRRDDILRAALACFIELGYEATTIADIRHRSGASVGSIYHHFQNKEGVAAALYLEALARYRQALLAEIEGIDDAETMIRRLVQHYLDWCSEHHTWARYLDSMRSLEPVAAVETEIDQATKRFLRTILARLQPAVDRGEIVKLPRSLYQSVIMGPAHELVRHWLRGRMDVDFAVAREVLADAAWRALHASPAARTPPPRAKAPRRSRPQR